MADADCTVVVCSLHRVIQASVFLTERDIVWPLRLLVAAGESSCMLRLGSGATAQYRQVLLSNVVHRAGKLVVAVLAPALAEEVRLCLH